MIPNTLASIEITCGACAFQIPAFARQVILQKDNLQTIEFVCPTCESKFRVSVQQTGCTVLTAESLELVRNKNR
jgi:hypothetical protein